MSSLLHITNGDHFTDKLKGLKLKGDIITWREMLCEGRTLTSVGSESFWKTRFEFLNKNYKISKSWFVEKTLKEYRSLCNHKQQDEIVLWFDYDLFCQVNMIAVLSWLKTHRKYAHISVVSGGENEETGRFACLGHLDDETLLQRYKDKIDLSQDDIEYADYVWQLYCSNNPIRLENLGDYSDFQFEHLGEAVKAHLQRFPTIKNGLNAMENRMLQIAMEKKPKNREAYLAEILDDQSTLGFGDSQYQRAIGRLKPLFSSLKPVRLTKKGKEILENKTSYYSCIRENDVYLGGALKYNFLYNSDAGRILKL